MGLEGDTPAVVRYLYGICTVFVRFLSVHVPYNNRTTTVQVADKYAGESLVACFQLVAEEIEKMAAVCGKKCNFAPEKSRH